MKIKTSHPVLSLLMLWLIMSGLSLAATTDHTKMPELEREFSSGPDVTRACLACHAEAARQIMKTKHWTWEYLNPSSHQRLGKRYVVNNFCIAAASNYAACTTCHIGYGWKDEQFNFSRAENVDCLVCHDTTGEYKKITGQAGHPAYREMEVPPGSGHIIKPVNLKKVAQKVGKTSRDTCGACHFYGGGGDGVKHGDMDSSLAAPDRELDVHMDATGLDYTCATCHMTKGHQVPGSRYAPTVTGGDNPGTCQACHGSTPHASAFALLNRHGAVLACQVCHIPAMARGGVATVMLWDWSTAGRLGADGKPMEKKDARGRLIYSSKKGSFIRSENVIPEYRWFNGKVNYTLLGDKVDKSASVTRINWFEGRADDDKSRIWPVKIMRGVQPYDPVNRSLVIAHTTGTDDASYWEHFNWEKAVAAGMDSVGAPFSGQVDFIMTEMIWPLNHMVAPKENALGCHDCHTPGGRMEGVPGVHIAP